MKFIEENKPLIEDICNLASLIQTYIDTIRKSIKDKG